MDPDINDLEPQLPAGTLGWTAYCPSEESAVGQTTATRDEAEEAAQSHNAETGHAAFATPVFLGGGENVGGEGMLSVAFCITYDGRPWHTVILTAPSPEAGLLTLQQLINLLNQIAANNGFAPRFAATLGACAIL